MDTSAHKYHGLINHGATCYLNSVLQVLFMTKKFREGVQRFTNDNPDVIDGHLKDIFNDLLQKTAYNYKILQALQIDRVYEQRDAAEYLEKILRLTSPGVAEIFHGQLTNSTTCSECETQTNRDGPFWYLPLPLVDSCSGDYRVIDGLEEFFRTSDLNGENQMYCDQCDTKVDAKRKSVVKHHPDILILLLKRFDFSYRYMSLVKINCAVDVPYTLKISENQKYELYATVDHFGDLRSGHYISAIKDPDEEDKWYYFDDASVTQLGNPPFLSYENYLKSTSAYLLFYRKKDVGAQETMVPINGVSLTSTCENFNQSHDAETERRTQEPEHTEDVNVDTVAAALDNSTLLTDTISVSREEEMSDQNLKAHHPEVKAEQVEPKWSDCFPEGHVREQEVQYPDNPEPVEFKEMSPDVNFSSVSERSAVEAVPYKQEEMSNAYRKELNEETEENRKTEKEEKLLNRDTAHHRDKDIDEYHCGNQTDGDDDGLKPADVDKEGDEERIEADFKEETEGRIVPDQVRPLEKKLLTKYDLYLLGCKIDHKKPNIPEDDQKHEQGKQEKENEVGVNIRGKDHKVGQNKSGKRNSVTHETQSPEVVEKHHKKQENERNKEGNVNSNFDITNNAKASLSTPVSCVKLCESSLLKQEKRRTKRVTDEQMEAAGIKHTLKKRSLKKSKYCGFSRQPRLAAYRERKRQNMRKYLGVFLSQKGRRTRVRIHRQIKRK